MEELEVMKNELKRLLDERDDLRRTQRYENFWAQQIDEMKLEVSSPTKVQEIQFKHLRDEAKQSNEKERKETEEKLERVHTLIGLQLRKIRDQYFGNQTTLRQNVEDARNRLQNFENSLENLKINLKNAQNALNNVDLKTVSASSYGELLQAIRDSETEIESGMSYIQKLREDVKVAEDELKDNNALVEQIGQFFGTISVKDIPSSEIKNMLKIKDEKEKKEEPVVAEKTSAEQEPVAGEEPSIEPEPVVAEEPSIEPETVVAEEPSVEPEPVVAEEPSAEPEPVVAEEPSIEPEPAVAEEPSAEQEPVVAEEPSVGPEPVVAPGPIVTPIATPEPVEEPTVKFFDNKFRLVSVNVNMSTGEIESIFSELDENGKEIAQRTVYGMAQEENVENVKKWCKENLVGYSRRLDPYVMSEIDRAIREIMPIDCSEEQIKSEVESSLNNYFFGINKGIVYYGCEEDQEPDNDLIKQEKEYMRYLKKKYPEAYHNCVSDELTPVFKPWYEKIKDGIKSKFDILKFKVANRKLLSRGEAREEYDESSEIKFEEPNQENDGNEPVKAPGNRLDEYLKSFKKKAQQEGNSPEQQVPTSRRLNTRDARREEVGPATPTLTSDKDDAYKNDDDGFYL